VYSPVFGGALTLAMMLDRVLLLLLLLLPLAQFLPWCEGLRVFGAACAAAVSTLTRLWDRLTPCVTDLRGGFKLALPPGAHLARCILTTAS
jgi:hypothetical protein